MPELTFLHTNDMHGRTESLSWLERNLSSYPREATLLLDAGDAIAGSNTAFRRFESNLVRMARLGYDAMTMGNREFHYLRRVLEWREDERGFPLLAANLEDMRGLNRWRRSLRFQKKKFAVGVVGATVVQYPVGAVWERLFGFRFLDPLLVLKSLIQELRADCDLVVFLSHLGLDVDRKAAEVLQPDLILGGHTHETTVEPVVVGSTTIVQNGSHGHYLGEIQAERQGSRWNFAYRLLSSRGDL